MDTGDLSRRTWSDYYTTCEDLIEAFGKERPILGLDSSDFEKLRVGFAKRLGPVALGIAIQRTRTVFKFAYDEGMIDRPVRFGSLFKKPSRKRILQARHAATRGVSELI